MQQVKISDLRSHLPDYIKRVSAGEQIQITSHGKIIARLVPEIDEVEAAQKRLDINFYKVDIDVDVNKKIVEKYLIKSIPTVVLIKNGKEIGRFSGSMSEEDLIKKLKEF